jgi:hypothetical protein
MDGTLFLECLDVVFKDISSIVCGKNCIIAFIMGFIGAMMTIYYGLSDFYSYRQLVDNMEKQQDKNKHPVGRLFSFVYSKFRGMFRGVVFCFFGGILSLILTYGETNIGNLLTKALIIGLTSETIVLQAYLKEHESKAIEALHKKRRGIKKKLEELYTIEYDVQSKITDNDVNNLREKIKRR